MSKKYSMGEDFFLHRKARSSNPNIYMLFIIRLVDEAKTCTIFVRLISSADLTYQ
jgi:hypothetical protein